MRFIVSNIIALLYVAFPFNHLIEAAEIRNIQTGQTARQAYIQYDLIGKPGEKEAEISVKLEVEGKRYSSDKLSLSGDFGRRVKAGIGKRIWWDVLKDMPAGFIGDIGWDIVTNETLSNDYFETCPKTVLDKNSGLMWAKLGKFSSEKYNYTRASSFVSTLNLKKFGGFSDWRVPTQKELESLIKNAKSSSKGASINSFKILKAFFGDLEDWRYWVRSSFFQGGFISVDIDSGDSTPELRFNNADNCILPVRGGKVDDELGEDL